MSGKMEHLHQPETPPATQSEFTAANVFGLFLTLTLCLLSQPVGSLLYCAGRPGPFRSLVLALWRLNPLACVSEALIISIAIGQTTWATLQNRQASFREWRTRLRRTAAALLLLRAQAWTKDGFLVVPRLFWVAGVEGYPPDRSMGYRELFTSLELEHQATTHGTREPPPPERPGLWPAAARIRMEKSFDLSRGTDVLPPPDNLRDGFPDLGQLLGSHASHSEVFIQAVASVGVLSVVVKIAASKLPWTVKLPASFMVAGWCAVQALLFLLQGGETSEAEMQKTAHVARDIDRAILSGTHVADQWRASWTRIGIIYVTPLPVAVWLAASIMTHTMFSEDNPKSFLWVLITIFEMGAIPPIILVLLSNIVSGVLFLGLVAITGLVLVLVYGPTPETGGLVMVYAVGYLHFFPLVLVLALPASLTPQEMVWGSNTGRLEAVGVVVHVVISFVLFLALFYYYDASKTVKPEWLEWLG